MFSNSTLVKENKLRNDIQYFSVPMTKLANEAGYNKLANMVALGALTTIIPILNETVLIKAVEKVLSDGKQHLINANIEALRLGIKDSTPTLV